MSIKNISLFLAVVGLSSCGFQPLHKPMNEVSVSAPFKVSVKGMDGFVRHHFDYHLSRNLNVLTLKNMPQSLVVDLKETQQSIGYGRDATELRGQEKLKASYTLSVNNQQVTGELESAISYFNISQDEFRNLTSKKETQKRAIEVLAQDLAKEIKIRLDNEG